MIYFIQSGDAVKIGHSYDPRYRVKHLGTGNPNCLLILGVMDGSENEEAAMHAKFKKYRIRGEWFALSDEIIDFVQENCKPILIRGGFLPAWKQAHPSNDTVLKVAFAIAFFGIYAQMIIGENYLTPLLIIAVSISTCIYTYKIIKFMIFETVTAWRYERAVKRLRSAS